MKILDECCFHYTGDCSNIATSYWTSDMNKFVYGYCGDSSLPHTPYRLYYQLSNCAVNQIRHAEKDDDRIKTILEKDRAYQRRTKRSQ